MGLTTEGKNRAAGAVSPTTMSLHTSLPNDVGVGGEASGGGYARKAMSLNAAAAGVRTLAATITFDLAAGTYSHYGLWDGADCLDVGTLNTNKVLNEAGKVDVTEGDITVT